MNKKVPVPAKDFFLIPCSLKSIAYLYNTNLFVYLPACMCGKNKKLNFIFF